MDKPTRIALTFLALCALVSAALPAAAQETPAPERTSVESEKTHPDSASAAVPGIPARMLPPRADLGVYLEHCSALDRSGCRSRKYAYRGAAVGAAAGMLLALVEDKSVVIGGVLFGFLGYAVGQFFD